MCAKKTPSERFFSDPPEIDFAIVEFLIVASVDAPIAKTGLSPIY
jgi:hypothetical protein